ncbi:MAG: Rieske 2Fe-2S domain-containing protein [Ignavibacteria bacterium]|nr:Rieske 2Fe-2S domain-containing protein [Ignavibacteria bacterium]
MGLKKFIIEPDIRKAETLPAEFYRSDEVFEIIKEKVFKNSWQLVTDLDKVKLPGSVFPYTFLEGIINEPLLITRDMDNNLHNLSNVCTHRGNLLIENAGVVNNLRCRYHGRKFEFNGDFKSMPECQDAINFPRPEDNLSKVPFKIWNKFIFASLFPKYSHEEIFKPINERLDGVIIPEMFQEPLRSKEYIVKCNWALYVDNYLEGFHIPYVHNSLNEVIDYGSYTTELFGHCNLQIAIAKPGGECFRMHEISPDYGNEIAAYYWWVFPNLMLNYYPWGLSINIVKPLTKELTKVSYLTYISDSTKIEKGAGSGLDKVEQEDEAIVEMVQRGMQSSFYKTGRYSPSREKGVHHFHRLLTAYLNDV